MTAAFGAIVAESIHPRLKSDIIANTNAALGMIKRGTTSEVQCVKENVLNILCFNNLKRQGMHLLAFSTGICRKTDLNISGYIYIGVETIEDMISLVSKVLSKMTLSKYLLVNSIIKKAASTYLQMFNVIMETGAHLLGSSGNSIYFTKFVSFC